MAAGQLQPLGLVQLSYAIYDYSSFSGEFSPRWGEKRFYSAVRLYFPIDSFWLIDLLIRSLAGYLMETNHLKLVCLL